MDYTNNFDIPSFSAGKTVAFSRSISIWISVMFFLIIAACGFILLGNHLKKNYPFLISIDPYTDEWTVVARSQEKNTVIQQYQVIQEKLVKDFTKNWFTISSNQDDNELRWEQCSVEECQKPEQFNPDNIKCAISCKASPELYEDFKEKVIPWYKSVIAQGVKNWNIQILISPLDEKSVSENTGVWQVITNITPNVHAPFKVLSFIKINRNTEKYPSTFGYYIEDFNSYRINNE